MKKISLLIIAIIFMASTCKKEGEDCHRKITIINKSNQDIMYGWKIKNTSNNCNLSVSIIKKEGVYELNRNNCWESILANGQPEEIYIVDTNHYNTPGVFYDCDSIEIKNTVLKHFILNLDDLKSSNFTVSYP